MWKQKDTKASRQQPLSGNFLAVQGLGFCTCTLGDGVGFQRTKILQALLLLLLLLLSRFSRVQICDPVNYTVQGILQDYSTGVGSLSLLQEIFPTQG